MTQGCGQAMGWQWALGSRSLLMPLAVTGDLVKMLRCLQGSARSLCAFSMVLFIQQRQGTQALYEGELHHVYWLACDAVSLWGPS